MAQLSNRLQRLAPSATLAMSQKSSDNFSKATDIAMVGYSFSDKVTLMAGKMSQVWGGYEYDANPMFVYQYSDMLDHMEIFQTGVTLSLKPVPTQEFALMVSDAHNGSLEDYYGNDAVLVTDNGDYRPLERANHPLTFIANWNGIFFDNQLQTRWAWGIQKEAQGMPRRVSGFPADAEVRYPRPAARFGRWTDA